MVEAVVGDEQMDKAERQRRVGARPHLQPHIGLSCQRGRPRALFARKRDAAHVIAVRISSHAVQYSLADYRGTMIDRFEEAREQGPETPARFLEGVRAALARLIQRSRLPASAISTISISSKGLVDREGAKLLWSPVFGYEELDFEAALSDFGGGRIMVDVRGAVEAGGTVTVDYVNGAVGVT